MPTLFTHHPHPYIEERKSHAPIKVANQLPLPKNSKASRFNSWLAIKITSGVGTMWCAYAFFILALLGLPTALHPGGEGIVAWVAQTFLQLVLLSIIIVGQNILSAASDKRSEATYKDADAVLHEALQIEKHLEAQDTAIEQILNGLAAYRAAIEGGGTPPPAAPPTAG
jgi:hypothetical protein